MYNQYDAQWKNQLLGTSNKTIGGYGCNLTSIAYGLKEHGWEYTPLTLNVIFTKNSSYSNSNLIDPARVASKTPILFKAGWREEWNDEKVKNYIKDYQNYIVVGEVDARGIGGTGQHFVLLLDLVLNNGKITNTLIGDPWGGLEQLVTIRYAKYGCIKSLRVYQVNSKGTSTPQTPSETSKPKEDMEILQFLDRPDANTAIVDLTAHLGESGNKCSWGNSEGDGGGYLGSERRKVAGLSAQLVKSQEECEDLNTQAKKDKDEIASLLKEVEDKAKENDKLKAESDKKDEKIKDLQETIKKLKENGACENKPLWEMIVDRLKELFA